jgi:hypothetical protein
MGYVVKEQRVGKARKLTKDEIRRKHAKPNRPLTEQMHTESSWSDAVTEIKALTRREFESCWPGIIVEAVHDSGLIGLSRMLNAVRERYCDAGAHR